MARYARILALGLALALALIACGDGESANNDSEVDTAREKMTDGYTYYVAYAPSPDPIPHNELFAMEVSLWESEAKQTPVTDADIAVTATMPAHGHGMNTEPTVTNHEDGTFTVEGMKLHMMSSTPEEKWVVDVEVTRDDASETATFNVMCCGE